MDRMKKIGWILTLLLVVTLLLLAGCGEEPTVPGTNGSSDGTTTTTESTTQSTENTTSTTETTEPTTGTTETSKDPDLDSPEPEVECTVSVVNGTIKNASANGVYLPGAQITLQADKSPKGYRFSHWENSNGEQVGSEETVQITVSQTETYKAYYSVAFGATMTGNTIAGDLSKDWQQGGISGKFDAFNKLDQSRISFAEPFFLKAGEILTVTAPRDTWTCPYASDNKADTIPCEGGCAIVVAKLILSKNEGVETGDLLTDYTLIEKATWASGGFSYTATKDCYVMITVKYDRHGNLPFHVEKPIMQQIKVLHSVKNAEAEREDLIGAYWKPELEDAIERIEANRESIGDDVSEFFFITDVHWKDHNAHSSPALINYLAEKLGSYHVIFGGDVIEFNSTRAGAINEEIIPFFEAFEKYTKVGEQLKIMSTLGNHDRNYLNRNPAAGTVLTDEDVYEHYVARTEGWAVTPENNPFCSYYDDAANKIRYVQFAYASNTVNPAGDLLEATLQWVEEQITALDGAWTVVLFSHGVFGGNEDERADAIKDRVLSWQTAAEAEIAIWITGHTHADSNEILLSKDGKSALRVISLNCDSYGKRGSNSFSMAYGTVTEQSFSFIQIDKSTQTIYLTRVGAGADLVFTYGSAMEGEYELAVQHSIRVVNGTVNGLYYTRVVDGTRVTLVADNAPAGYAFSCWKNRRGEVVGRTATLVITATESTQYKPYYEDVDPSDDEVGANEVMTDLANDWMPGGLSNMPLEWWLDGSLRTSRTCFAEPLLLKKGETLTVVLPDIECPTGACANGCKLISLIAVMDKTGECETGYIPMEYSVTYSQWKVSYTATKDCYVIVMIKYDKHGNVDFSKENEEMRDVRILVTSKKEQGEP